MRANPARSKKINVAIAIFLMLMKFSVDSGWLPQRQEAISADGSRGVPVSMVGFDWAGHDAWHLCSRCGGARGGEPAAGIAVFLTRASTAPAFDKGAHV